MTRQVLPAKSGFPLKKNKKLAALHTTGRPDSSDATRRLANSLLVTGDFTRAETFYRDVLRRIPNDFESAHMLGVIALRSGRVQEAVTLIARAARLNSKDAQVLANLGSAFVYAGRPAEAIRAYEKSISIDPNLAGALSNLGTTQLLLQRYEDAAGSFRRLWELAPDYDFACGSLSQASRYGCDWLDFAELRAAIRAGLSGAKNVDRPFSFLSVSGSGSEQLRCARLHANHLCPAPGPPLWRHERYAHDRIRLAYVSADSSNHVVMQLLQPVLQRHDRTRFQIFGVSLAHHRGGDGARLRSMFDHFIDGAGLAVDDVAAMLRQHEVDIAIDLTGFTEGCKPGVFARRAAPVQVNFLGFPGTMGTSFHDYIIADEFVVPESSRGFYSEHIVRLPDTFQPNAALEGRCAAPAPGSREAAGLPPAGAVLCSFNNSYKLNPEVFGIWARVLKNVPDSVLWLVADAGSQRRLRAEALTHGLSAARLVFARRLPYAEHLARLPLADLFLDTFPFNGGATTGDALRAGLPVITCAGETFASRMGGSLLRAIGLEDLVTDNPRDYERLATELAADPSRLSALKARLMANRNTAPLFDTGAYCVHLEAAYQQMWQRAERGEAATDLWVRHARADARSY